MREEIDFSTVIGIVFTLLLGLAVFIQYFNGTLQISLPGLMFAITIPSIMIGMLYVADKIPHKEETKEE